MNKGKILAFIGMAIIGTSTFVMLSFSRTEAQSAVRPLTLASITTVSSSNPAGNYSRNASNEIVNDNNGISVWTGNFPTPYTECGHLGMAANLARTADAQQANVWENRANCNGSIAIGIADSVQEQILTISGTSTEGRNVTVQVNVPAMIGVGGNWRLYVDDNGSTYHCRADHSYVSNRYPNDCDLTSSQALTSTNLARTGSAICGNNLCQGGESYSSCSQDCQAPTCTLSLNGGVTSYPTDSTTFVNYSYTCSAPTSVAVQVVKPDGTATTYNSATNITTSQMGFGTSNLTPGNYTLRICVNDITCPSSSLVSVPFTITSATSAVPAAPTNLTAVYSTANLGQREVVLTVTDNAANETYHQLYWRLYGTSWPSTAPRDTYNSYTWTQPSNVGRMQMGAPTAAGTYEYKLQACNAAGCSTSNVASVVVPGTSSTNNNNNTTTTTAPAAPTNLTAVYSTANLGQREVVLTVTDNANNETEYRLYWRLYGTSWASTFNATGTATWSFPANTGGMQIAAPTTAGTYEYKVMACNSVGCSTSNVVSVVVPVATSTTNTNTNTTPTSTTNNTNTSTGSNTSGTSGFSSGNCTKLNLNLDKTTYIKGDSVNYTYSCSTPAIGSLIQTAIVQLVKPDGTATTYVTGSNISTATSAMGFDTSNLNAGAYTLRVCMEISCPAASTTSVNFTITGNGTVATAPTACANGQKCSAGSWCQSGMQCYYPDSQINCVAWPTATAGTTAMPYANAAVTSPVCPAGTSVCNPTDANCVAPGQTLPYSSAKWCAQGSMYYSKDGRNMTCVKYPVTTPAGYSACKPDDSNCIAEESYGASAGWCANSMKCYQKAIDTNSQNDVYCTKYSATPNESPICPLGYSVCSPTDTLCKQKGERWADANSGYYCMNAQKCGGATGGGSCVGWNEDCPSGTKYCSENDNNCIEPGDYKTISSATSNYYWCGGGGMVFYSQSKAYCEKKSRTAAAGSVADMWTAAELKTILGRLGTGWGLCRPGESNCIEPGKSGSSTGWCAWMPPGYYGALSSSAAASTRSCPGFDEKVAVQNVDPNIITPPVTTEQIRNVAEKTPEMRECSPDELPFNCRMPMYRWNIKDKTWEKCDVNNIPAYVDVKGTTGVKYTNCEAMNFNVEREWRTERNKVHPPEIVGEWYMPPWDAASKQVQYNPKTDQLVECSTAAMPAYTAGTTAEYIAPCSPVPEIDRSWMLKKFRAEYKMYQLWNVQQKAMPTIPGKPITAETLDAMIKPVQTTEIPVAQCKPYLAGIKQGLLGDKQFWKDTNVQFKQVKAEYEDADAVNELLQKTKTLILEIDKLVKAGTCEQEDVQLIQVKLDQLHTDLYPQLVAYTPALNDYLAYKQCRRDLNNLLTRFEKLLNNKKISEKNRVEATARTKSIKDKLQEFDSAGQDDFEYDKTFECTDFKRTFQEETAAFVKGGDKEITRIIDDVVAAKMKANVAELQAQLEERGQKIDLLMLQVAELHQSIEAMSQQATFISEQIAVSYSALTRINDRFEQQKAQMQIAKGEIIPLVEQATKTIQETSCVSSADREVLIKEFGQIAAINWLGDKADEIQKRLNLFVTSCQAKEVVPGDVAALTAAVMSADEQNLQNSYAQGLTPFADVPTHEWYYGAMVTASDSGAMTQGRPAENVLRQDALLMVLRAAGATDAELVGECDVTGVPVIAVSPYAKCAAKLAYEKGLNLRGPMNAPVSRVEIAQWLEKLMSLTTSADDSILDKYVDLKGLSAAEKGPVKAVIASEIMIGNVSGETANFTPRDPLTRAALAVIIEKILSLKGTLPK
ncbi:MAG: hypothetical protein WCT53_03980 [Candidatus Gracilibacteria bacterium]